MTQYTINIVESYEVPEGQLTVQQYVNFVMNKAAESYMNQYDVATTEQGIQSACNAYNLTKQTIV